MRLAVLLLATPLFAQTPDMIEAESPHDVATTVGCLTDAVEAAGARVFATVDHAAGAASIGEDMADMTLVIFGNPRIGTPFLQAEPMMGIELPIRALVWDDAGQTRLAATAPEALTARYGVELAEPAGRVRGAITNLFGAAASC